MTEIQAVILGVIEGFTEFLPISSTAHLILASDVLRITQSDYVKSFEIIIQLGAVLAVVWLYWKDLVKIEILKKLLVAFLPTGILGFLFYKAVKNYLLGNISVVLWSLAVGGIFLILLEKFLRGTKQETLDMNAISYRQCLALGLFQSVAMIPGVSRSAATIVGGLLMGIPRKTIVEFSFLLAVPTMAAATGLDLLKSAGAWNADQAGVLLLGFVVSFITAVLAVKWLLRYIARHTFTSFGIYRLLLVLIFLLHG
ncbi:MAG: undecaprenyl-diphosphate phosphatase [Candidatus Liptonbacteria bacterium]|nr:undecaprenyl-diphosphate phosphatase [Candidatus Liptonbacteria bacterium]